MSASSSSIRIPAEWEPHAATWLSWPHADGCTFPGDTVRRILPTMHQIVATLASSELVYVNVRDAREEADLFGGIPGHLRANVRAVMIPTNEPWCRDHGPVFVERDGRPLATCWRFAAWGGKYEPWDDDARAAQAIAAAAGIPNEPIGHVLEGGMIDVDGCGTALVSRRAMLDPNRNPELDEASAEAVLRAHLGIHRAIWLDAQVPGDDTDGHVDTYARFVAGGRVLLCLDPEGEDFRAVSAVIRKAIPGVEIIAVRPPEPFIMHGDEVPASYANFYIANSVVLVPVFRQPGDAAAVDTFGEIFPGRKIVPIDCRELIWGLGAIHCLTCPLPPAAGSRDLPA